MTAQEERYSLYSLHPDTHPCAMGISAHFTMIDLGPEATTSDWENMQALRKWLLYSDPRNLNPLPITQLQAPPPAA